MARQYKISPFLNLFKTIPHVKIVDVPADGNKFQEVVRTPLHVFLDEYGIACDDDDSLFCPNGNGLVADGMTGRREQGDVGVIFEFTVKGLKGTIFVWGLQS
jgi:hypothetical protein